MKWMISWRQLILVSVLLSFSTCNSPSWPQNLVNPCKTSIVVFVVCVDGRRVSQLESHQQLLLLLLIYYWGCGEEAVTQRRCVCERLRSDRTDVLHDVSLMYAVLFVLLILMLCVCVCRCKQCMSLGRWLLWGSQRTSREMWRSLRSGTVAGRKCMWFR